MKPTEQPKFDLSLYNDEFFQWHLTHVHDSAVKCMEWYCDSYKPKSVLDIGCGIGSYLLGALNKRVTVCGIEISPKARKYTDKRLGGKILYEDGTREEILSSYKFECVICTETAEHILPQKSEQLIKNICENSGGRILFSAAPPGQDGCGHINLKPKEYWIELFQKLGRHPLESTTEHIASHWQKLGAPDYIFNNLIVL